ncbi:VCBS repeat-containing protein [Zobellia galactanivorans]|uniref:VCBS repeat-containing protein n=1 Tax=Zobellia galactanivorans (strain DSM 12802 / CCUG 47099 / CIP 106680 / NCIMB 13871 / Dsij) TaxID=63186 RepID=UPI001C06A74C|nr:VCBS repeat-containing protein [Zobellia galactanivorans]MBU3028205.1 VCBS repeat-containing protein [Zobellia galactanivorans]
MKKALVLIWVGTLSFFILSCSEKKQEPPFLFQKRKNSQTGITFKNALKNTPELNILNYLYYYNGAGIAAADFNNDGSVDLYFTANEAADHFYLNQGGLKFKEISQKAGINNTEGWTTGVTHVDINNDGLLDLYICKVGKYKHMEGSNLLYVNQGNDKDGNPVFKEEAKKYGLDFSGFSTQAAFFDYDLDGDLDLFLLNHSVHPNRTYGKGSKRKKTAPLSGDRLYKNENGKFVDVSSEAHIFQGEIGYGLGLGISDVNNDGYPDVYVGNDFFENDYLYINQKDGTFKEIISENDKKLGHTTHFSMGNDLADINNDGLTDIVSLDMLPENLETYKTSGLEYPYPTYQNYLRNGYAPQYMQNTLHLNLGHGNFSEIAHLAGISATEWSWGALLADYDNDGLKDLFVSNGIKGATNDMDFINFIANDNIQKRIEEGMTEEDMAFIDEMPHKKEPNYFFRNKGDLTFENVSKTWSDLEKSYSNGSVYADLDNDGDLDIVVNNVDQEAFVLENTSETTAENHFLNIGFKGAPSNLFGIGAKVIAYSKNKAISAENFVSRGYLSSVPPRLHLGIGKDSVLDSVKVIWPGGKFQTLKNLQADQKIELSISEARGNYYETPKTSAATLLHNKNDFLGFYHKDSPTLEFNRSPLVPFANTNEGPEISVADINADGLDDILIGGGKGQATALFVQRPNGVFKEEQTGLFEEDAINEDLSQLIFDADGDGDQDLIIVSGGNEFQSGKPLQPRFYRNHEGQFKKEDQQFSNISPNASKVGSVDFDNDGDLDLIIASDQVPHQFGTTPSQYIFENDGSGNFTDVSDTFGKAFKGVGNVKDFIWTDLDGNGFQDLIAVGHWMPVSIFYNDGKSLQPRKDPALKNTNGWWNVVVADDFDNDGDIDFVAGNWGLNSKFRASATEAITLYNADFDENGNIDPIVTYFHHHKETPFASKDELVKQLPYLNKRFLSYKDFAQASVFDLFSKEKLTKSDQKKVYELQSSFYENDGVGNFNIKALPTIAQASTIHDIAVDDFDNDGFKDLLIVGNSTEISTQLGRMDASHGIILRNNGKGDFEWSDGQDFNIEGSARSIAKIRINNHPVYIVGINNDVPVFLSRKSNN